MKQRCSLQDSIYRTRAAVNIIMRQGRRSTLQAKHTAWYCRCNTGKYLQIKAAKCLTLVVCVRPQVVHVNHVQTPQDPTK